LPVTFNPYTAISNGASDTTQINAVIAGLNALLTGFGQGGSVAATGGPMTVTTTPTDVPSCTTTVTVTGSNAYAEVVATFDFANNATGTTNAAIGTLVVNGAAQTAEAHMQLTANNRATVSQSYKVPLSAVGSTTLKMQVAKDGGASVCTIFDTHTTLKVSVFDVP
jgi:hypothetical protein